jgi:AP-1 complex subunit sigma 1/2
VRLSKW